MAEIKSLISQCMQVEGMLRLISERDTAEGRETLAEMFETFENSMNAFLGVHVVEPDCAVGTGAEFPVEQALGAAVLISESTQSQVAGGMRGIDQAREKMDVEIEVDDDDEILAGSGSADVAETELPADNYGIDAGDVLALATGADVCAHSGCRHLAQAFTVNDRFRFSRALFGGDVDDFADTVEVLSGMESYQDAEDYLLNDLAWDAESPEVAEFLEIVGNCMQG